MRAKSAKRGPRRPFSQGPRIRTRLASSRRFRAGKARGRNFERFPDLRRISSTPRPDAASTRAVDSRRTSARASVPNSSRSMRATAPVATSRRKSSPGASHDGRRRRLGRPRSPETLPVEGGITGRPPRAREASPRRRRDRLLDQAERDPRDRRRVGLREDDHGPPPRETRRAHGRPTPVPRQRHRRAEGRAAEGLPSPRADDLPRSVRIAQPALHRDGCGRGAADGSRRDGFPRGSGGFDREGARARGTRTGIGLHDPVSARAERRPTPTGRHPAGDRPPPGVHRRGRAGVRARRLDPCGRHESPAPAPRRIPPDAGVHLSRRRGDAVHVRPNRGHVPGADRRARDRRGGHRAPVASVHAGTPNLGAGAGSEVPARPSEDLGRAPEPDRLAERMHVPSALPVRARNLQDDETRVAGDRAGPLRGMPLRRRSRIVFGCTSCRGHGIRRRAPDMTWFAKVAAVFLAVLAIVGAIVWVNFLDRYIAASDARMQIGGNVGYQNVTIPAVTSPDQNVTVGVRFFLRNPSGIAIDIMQISYRFYMDNLTDTRSFAEKGASIFVVAGGFFPPGIGYVVGPHSTADVWGNATVFGETQPTQLARLNLTFGGRYFPIIDASLVYRVHGTSIVERVLGIEFATSGGIVPYGS